MDHTSFIKSMDAFSRVMYQQPTADFLAVAAHAQHSAGGPGAGPSHGPGPPGRETALVNHLNQHAGGGDKRNRNPNWTDGEIIRFLELLQEEATLRDLMAQRNKQVFCYVAQRLCDEGAEKSWDQCRIKLKNLKSQYRYVKERLPQIMNLDLEDDEVLKRLMADCQNRGISPSSMKHLRYLRRFLNKLNNVKNRAPFAEKTSENSSINFNNSGNNKNMIERQQQFMMNRHTSTGLHLRMLPDGPSSVSCVPQLDCSETSSMDGLNSGVKQNIIRAHSVASQGQRRDLDELEEPVSPPSTPFPQKHVKIIHESDDEADIENIVIDEPDIKRPRLGNESEASNNGLRNNIVDSGSTGGGSSTSGYGGSTSRANHQTSLSSSSSNSGATASGMVESFNHAIMEQFLQHQRSMQVNFHQWEMERQRQHEVAMERWRHQQREHEKQMFGLFVQVMSECNSALVNMSNRFQRERAESNSSYLRHQSASSSAGYSSGGSNSGSSSPGNGRSQPQSAEISNREEATKKDQGLLGGTEGTGHTENKCEGDGEQLNSQNN